MPRFGTRTLLIGFALAALWLSTFSGFIGAADVRKSMLLLILVAAVFAAIYGKGRRRAFWTGFATVMFLCGGLEMQRPLNRYVPDFTWQWSMGVTIQPPTVSPYLNPAYAPAPANSWTTSAQPPRVVYSAPTPYYPMATPRPVAWFAFAETLAVAWTLGLSALGGFIAAYFLARSGASPNERTLSARQIVEQELHR